MYSFCRSIHFALFVLLFSLKGGEANRIAPSIFITHITIVIIIVNDELS